MALTSPQLEWRAGSDDTPRTERRRPRRERCSDADSRGEWGGGGWISRNCRPAGGRRASRGGEAMGPGARMGALGEKEGGEADGRWGSRERRRGHYGFGDDIHSANRSLRWRGDLRLVGK